MDRRCLIVNGSALVAVPLDVVTEIVPVVAPFGTVAVICVPESTVNVADLLFENFTAVAPVKFVPVIVTDVPPGPELGVNEVIVGTPVTVKSVELVAVPPAVVTLILPPPDVEKGPAPSGAGPWYFAPLERLLLG